MGSANNPEILTEQQGLRLKGAWTLRLLAPRSGKIRAALAAAPADAAWRLDDIEVLDSFGATLLWHAWGKRWPANISISDELRAIIDLVGKSAAQELPEPPPTTLLDRVAGLGQTLLTFFEHCIGFVHLLGQLGLDILYLLRHPREWPLREISANIFKVGVAAMPVTALVGFLIGVVLSYLFALQLKAFGADVFIVNILGLGIIREMGPVLVSVLVAGRSGSAMTAQLGVMRVTEEIDALSAMGISRTLRLVLPKVLALSLAMPLLVLWTSAVALLGGMLSAWAQLDLSFSFFLQTLPAVVPLANIFIALAKGFAFGIMISLVSCHFGLRVQPNTESLSANTTSAVVSAITIVILADAIFAISTRSIGVP